MEQRIFTAKLCELEEGYGRMQDRIRACQRKDHEEIRRELCMATEECREKDRLLQREAEFGRSAAVCALARAQLRYAGELEELLKQGPSAGFSDEKEQSAEDCAEAMALYAEYAIDFAGQAVSHALRASLTALDMRMDCEEMKEETT